jgi:hypothetical protein
VAQASADRLLQEGDVLTRVREPICAEPDSRDLGVADPQHGRDVRLEHVHPFLIGGSLVGCRLSPVLRAPEGFQGGRAGFEGAWRWGNRGTLWPAEGAALRACSRGQGRRSKPLSDLDISQSRSRPMPSHLLVAIGNLKQWHLPSSGIARE